MIGLDTNVLIRYLTQDDPLLSPKATALVERELSIENPGYVTVITMVEIAWVLGSSYGLPDEQVADNIERILGADALLVEREQYVYRAMLSLREGAADFSDALIGLLAGRAGCSHTVTFDRRASRLDGFALLS
ncbi:MAG: PIN domain-containing protein [Rhizomicrobium sp.]